MKGAFLYARDAVVFARSTRGSKQGREMRVYVLVVVNDTKNRRALRLELSIHTHERTRTNAIGPPTEIHQNPPASNVALSYPSTEPSFVHDTYYSLS